MFTKFKCLKYISTELRKHFEKFDRQDVK